MARNAFSRRAQTLGLTLISALATPSLANAATAWDSPVAASKSAAILGGAPSALEAILAQQGAKPSSARSMLQPAAYSAPYLRPRPALIERAADDVTSGRPDVFGTVALKVRHTKLDWRWRQVRDGAVAGRARAFAASLGTHEPLDRIEQVNHFVNRAVAFADDIKQHGRADVWTGAGETLRKGRGDCEDYAIAKYQMLRAAGFDTRDLYLVIAKDLVRRQDHAVLVVRSGERFLLLDSGTDAVVDTREVADYRPVLTFAADGAWTHGYRVARKPQLTMASAEDEDSKPLGVFAEDQRSRIASPLALSTGFNR